MCKGAILFGAVIFLAAAPSSAAIPGDINGDGLVNLSDAGAFSTIATGDPYASLRYGDFNIDSKVAFDDYLILEQNFGTAATQKNGDADGDGTVTFRDYLLLENHFGSHYSLTQQALPCDLNGNGVIDFSDYIREEALIGGHPTPEPATLLLVAMGGLSMLKRRK